MGYRWDVTHAKEIAAELPVHRFDPQSWLGYLGMVAVDKEFVPRADLGSPVIVVHINEANGNP